VQAGDAIGEARSRILLSRCPAIGDLDPPSEAARAFAIATERSLAVHRGEAWALAWLHGADLPRPEVSTDHHAVLVAAGDVRRGDLVAIGHLARHLASVPPSHHPHLLRLASGAFGVAGLTILRAGSPPVIRIAESTLWIDDARHDFGRARLLLDLFETIATRGGDLDRAALFETVWKQRYRPPSSDDTVHVNLRRLRERLEGRVDVQPTPSGGFQLSGPVFLVRQARTEQLG
jgi:hypothetical protein